MLKVRLHAGRKQGVLPGSRSLPIPCGQSALEGECLSHFSTSTSSN